MVNLCAATLILKMEENTQILSISCFIISRKLKTQLKLKKKKKDLCHVWRRRCDWLNVSKVVCKISWYYWHFGQIIFCCGAVLGIGRCLAEPLASTHQKPIAGNSQHTQNIQINKVIGENEKCVFYFTEKTKRTFWPTQY